MSIANHTPVTPSSPPAAWRCLTGLLLLGALNLAQAALTDLADAPFFNSTSSLLKPNIMLLMDTSNSMRFSHMPDEIEGSNSGFMPIGYKSYQCNALYYNPNQAYVLPKDGSGNALPTPNFNAARYNHYSADETTVNLATSFRAYDTSTRQFQTVADPAQPAYYYVLTGATVNNYLATQCADIDPGTTVAASGGGTWNRVIVSATSGPGGTDERQNFATWYTYYRTRISLSKSAVSLAFSALNDSYRVGLITVRPDLSGTANYLPIADFDSSQRSAWYAKLFSQVPGGSSPSREALARVGRHYAGKQDGINAGMTGDPVQYSCQQNFTIMTTDGYWNTAAETAGPVALDGITLVGQQDGTLTDNNGWTPRPIWDGGIDSARATTDQMWQYRSVACASPYATLSTSRLLRSTLQNLASTSQTTMSTSQILQSTYRYLRSTQQNLINSSQNLQSTAQIRESTLQKLASTSQWLQSTSQIQQTSSQPTITTRQTTQSTIQNLASTSQVVKNTSQQLQSTIQILKSTVQNLKSTNQILQSTVQNVESTSQIRKSTVQNLRNTSRIDQTTVVVNKTTVQNLAYDAATELTTPVLSCTAGGTISCSTVTTGPTAVSSCTPAAANAGNLYTATTCDTTTTGPTPVSSCTAGSASASNAYTTTTCTPVTTTSVPVASCSPATASSGNNWTTTTCSTANVTTNVPVASCTPGTASASDPIPYLVTTCPAPLTTTNVPVASCTPQTASASNNYVTRTCPAPITTTNVGASSCTPSSASASNNWTTTTCPTPATTSNVPVASCTPQAASSGNSWVTTTCSTANVTTNVPAASCTAGTALSTAAIPYLVTTCPTPNTTTNVPVASCTASSASSSNNYTSTTCSTSTQTNVPTQICEAATASSANNYTTTTCPAPLTTTNVPVASCTPQTAAAGNNWLTRTCPTPLTTTNVPVASCTPQTAAASNSYVTRTCTGPTILSGPTVTGSCTAAAPSSGNNYIETLCGSSSSTVGASSCTPQTGSSGNNWTTITCNTVTTSNVPVASCTPQTASSSNGWVTVTCNNVVTTNVPVASCTAQTASSANSWITRTCPAPITTTNVPVASCTPQTAASGNNWVTRSCNTLTTANVPVAACTAQAASAGNNWTTTSCPAPIVVTNQPQAAACVPQTANAANQWTTITCPAPVVTSNEPIENCTAAEPALANNYVRVTCSTDNVTTNVPVASCPGGVDGSKTHFICSTVTPLIDSPVASCTPADANEGNNFTKVTCNTNTTTNQAVESCTPQTAAAGNNWLTRTCPAPVVTADQPVASCTPQPPSSSNNYTSVSCSVQNTDPTEVANCTSSAASAANGWTTTSCTPLPGHLLQRRLRTTQSTASLSGGVVVQQSTPTNTDGEWTNVDGICHPDASTLAPALGPVPQDTRASATDVVPPSGCSEWPCSVDSPPQPGSQNSLADVAQYYYVNDLRPEMTNDVRTKGSGPEEDRATHQHMTTFTLALGVSGTLDYSPTYKLDAVGDFARIRCDPLTGACNNACPSTDPSYPNCTAKRWPLWPDPSIPYSSDGSLYSDPRSIDDFWHTAVNGRGQYFSANDPAAVVDGLQKALAGVLARLGAGSPVTVSAVEPVAGNNLAYRATFITEEWVGDVKAYTINPATGVISTSSTWSAQEKLDAKIGPGCDRRTIYLFRLGATNNLTPFTYNTRTCDAANQPTGTATTGLNATEQAYFGADSIVQLSQYAAMSDGSNGTVDQRSAAQGANLVNFLRGQRDFEGPALFKSNDLTKLFRSRTHTLGDIVGSQPAYIGPPGASYADNGFAAFKTANAGRATVIYAGANDGMLHAFNASTGEELWAYIPRLVLPRLFRLADNNYSNAHQFYVDGNLSVADIDANAGGEGSPAWQTILVGSLNKGGKGYYALDVTDPAQPKALWEFGWSSTCWDGASPASGDCHVGYSYGKPIISKLQDGRWVVIVASGMNNVNSPTLTGDGQGYLYVLNAANGTLIAKISTGVGSAATPSGLAHLTNFVDNIAINNTSLRVYGGDLLGNIWRFDINDNLAPSGLEATLLGTAKTSSGTPQPISTRLELGEINGKPWVFAGTGRLWGVSDLADTQRQSLYAVRDPLTGSPVYSDLRGSLNQLAFTQVGSGDSAYRTTACVGTCTGTNGWVIDLPDDGERVNVAPQLQLGTIVFLSNVPSTSVCNVGGSGWINFFDFRTGLAVVSSADQATSRRFDSAYSVGSTIIRTTDRQLRGIVRGADDTQNVRDLPNPPPPPAGKRVSWREIID